jgi:hypothetical protein
MKLDVEDISSLSDFIVPQPQTTHYHYSQSENLIENRYGMK